MKRALTPMGQAHRIAVITAIAGFLALAGVLGHSCARADEGAHLHIVSGHNPPLANDRHTGFNDLILREAFRRAGLKIHLRRVPTARAGPLANSGREDGCGPRIASYSEHFPDLVPIRESALTFEFVAFTTRAQLSVGDWRQLGDYTVGHLTGSVILARNSRKYAGSVTSVRSVRQLFSMLDRGRIDVAIIERWTGLHAAKQLGLKNVRMLRPALARKPMYFFLNRRHAALAPRIAAALREMKADGTYDRTMVSTLNPLLHGF